MQRDEVTASVAFPHPLRKRAHHLDVALAVEQPIAAQNPDDRLVAVPRGEPLRVRPGGLAGEDALLLPPLAPSRKHCDGEPAVVRRVDDEVDVVPVVVVRAFLHGRNRSLRVHERREAIGIRSAYAILLRDCDRLHHGKTERAPVVEVANRLLAVETVKELPCGVGEIEERLSVHGLEKVPVRAHPDVRRTRGGGGRRGKHRRGAKNRAPGKWNSVDHVRFHSMTPLCCQDAMNTHSPRFAESLATATAWFAPFPPGFMKNVPPDTISPGTGIRFPLMTMSVLVLPSTTIFFSSCQSRVVG